MLGGYELWFDRHIWKVYHIKSNQIKALLILYVRVYLRFMSPFTSREKMFDKLPPGQQPQMSTVTAFMGCICRILAREKAVMGMMQNWATRAMATPFGSRRWAFILEISIVQPSDIIVMKRMAIVKIFMTVFTVPEMFRMPALLFPGMFPSWKMLAVPTSPAVTFIVPVLPVPL